MYDRKAAGKRMQELRRKLQLTQEKMGDELGFTRSKISNLETARRDICMSDAILLCDFLGVSLDTLFCPRKISTTSDFLILANIYATNERIPEQERKEALKSLLEYL